MSAYAGHVRFSSAPAQCRTIMRTSPRNLQRAIAPDALSCNRMENRIRQHYERRLSFVTCCICKALELNKSMSLCLAMRSIDMGKNERFNCATTSSHMAQSHTRRCGGRSAVFERSIDIKYLPYSRSAPVLTYAYGNALSYSRNYDACTAVRKIMVTRGA
jgi:hypothetical protein